MRSNLKRDGTKTIELRKDEQGALKYARVIIRELALHEDPDAEAGYDTICRLVAKYAPLPEVEE